MNRMVTTGFLAMALVAASTANAQQLPQAPQSFQRGWIDVNLGVASAAESRFEMTAADIVASEPRTARARHRLSTGADFDFGGGVMVTPMVGFGVTFTGTAHEDPVDLDVRVPHPRFFNAFASDTSVTDRSLARVEGGFGIQVMFMPVAREDVRFRIFGGPTYFQVEQDAIATILYHQSFNVLLPLNEVTITEYDARTVEGTGWGAHVGADVSWFFSRVVGLGAMARFMRGSVEIENALDTGTVEVKAGGFQMGGGLRLRF